MRDDVHSAHAYIPHGAWWCTPFVRWQGAFAHVHAMDLAAAAAKEGLARAGVAAEEIETGALGLTVPQEGSFYGLPWLGAKIGAPRLAGPTIAQACATGPRVLATAAAMVGEGAPVALAVCADRISNGPELAWPDPTGVGGAARREHWVLDNFGRDPATGQPMIATAENVAGELNISTEEQHDVVLRRFEQYGDALAEDAAFQRSWMLRPFEVPPPGGRGAPLSIDGDQGAQSAHPDKLKRLKPVREGGTVTYAGQTHPADGAAGLIATDRNGARERARDRAVEIRIFGFGQGRAAPAMMPLAPIAATERALKATGLAIGDMDAVKSHNPFAVNDIAFARHFGTDVMAMNNFGCSLVWGHPHAATGLRAIIELVEELIGRGGGLGLFQGCAAGDTSMAAIIEVRDAR